MSENVDLSAALGNTATTTSEKPKKRERTKGLPYPPLAEGKRVYTAAVEVNPATQGCPPERMFNDPLHYQQTRVNFAKALLVFAEAKVAELAGMSPEARTAARKEKMEKAAAARALKSETVKQEIAKDPSLLVGLAGSMSPEQLAALVSQLNSLMATKAIG